MVQGGIPFGEDSDGAEDRYCPQDLRELPCSLHGGEGIRVQRFCLPPSYPRIHVPGWRLHCWAEHQRLAVLPVHREDPVARWEARCVRAGVRGGGGGEENRELRVPVWKNFEEDSYHRLWPVLMFSSAVLSFNGELFDL